MAAEEGHLKVCEYLVGQGADMYIQNEVSRDWRMEGGCMCICVNVNKNECGGC
jgi:hypothetical protein